MFEINLVPDVKNEMIKALKIRNLILFICIVVSAAAIGVVLVLFSIKGGQDFAMSQQDNKLKTLSGKLMNYDGLDEFLTIQDQLGKISGLTENKQAASRVFSILGVMLPQGNDRVTLSSLNVNLEDIENPVLEMEGQADAQVEPYIDYRVLESFKKNTALINYDYGRYVDENGNEIPTACIEEIGEDGNVLQENGNYYVNWYKNRKGCDPSKTESEDGQADSSSETTEGVDENEKTQIWRTPQYNKWYKAQQMTLDGEISGVAHFASECVKYSGLETGNTVKWSSENSCLVAEDGVVVSESSNAKDDSDNLVLRFTATAQINPEVFAYKNKHMMLFGPTGQNVTDSFVQIEDMFAKRAEDCKAGDTSCQNTENSTGAGSSSTTNSANVTNRTGN